MNSDAMDNYNETAGLGDQERACGALDVSEECARISDELRREIWHGRMPGRSTEEKIQFLLEFYSRGNTPVDRIDNEYHEMPEDSDKFVLLPDRLINIFVDVECLDCEAAGFTDMIVMEDGWYLRSRIKCPICEGERIAVADFKARSDAGL